MWHICDILQLSSDAAVIYEELAGEKQKSGKWKSNKAMQCTDCALQWMIQIQIEKCIQIQIEVCTQIHIEICIQIQIEICI